MQYSIQKHLCGRNVDICLNHKNSRISSQQHIAGCVNIKKSVGCMDKGNQPGVLHLRAVAVDESHMELKMTSRRTFEKKLGLFFMILWILVSVFYMTWDGWLFEWRECGYSGPNQQFNLRISDMNYVRNPDGSITYRNTNNLHNLLYICHLVFLMGRSCCSLTLIGHVRRQWQRQEFLSEQHSHRFTILTISTYSWLSTMLFISPECSWDCASS